MIRTPLSAKTPTTALGALGLNSPAGHSSYGLMSPAAGILSPYPSAFPSSYSGPSDAGMTPGGSVILKQVVTRTMTFARPPAAPLMEPVPASKKRRIEGPIVEEGFGEAMDVTGGEMKREVVESG